MDPVLYRVEREFETKNPVNFSCNVAPSAQDKCLSTFSKIKDRQKVASVILTELFHRFSKKFNAMFLFSTCLDKINIPGMYT